MTIRVPLLRPNQQDRLESWLRALLWESVLPSAEGEGGANEQVFTIHRVKGQIPINDGSSIMIQGVRDVFEMIDQGGGGSGSDGLGKRKGKIVLIGKGLVGLPFQESLLESLR